MNSSDDNLPRVPWNVADSMLTIVLPYRRAEHLAMIWSESEADIVFRRQPRQACRCTLAFAAMEMRRYLARTVPNLEIRIAAQSPRSGFAIILEAVNPESRSDVFALIPDGPRRLRIRGEGRTGVLFGAYSFLKMQGWRWLAPGTSGEIAPGPADRLHVPAARLDVRPRLDAGRGFDMAYPSMESHHLLLWSVRNGLNVWAASGATLPLAGKLGVTLKTGGHIFEKILHPDIPLPDGRKLWDAHADWFGLPADGIRRRETAQRTQFCVSRPELFEYLGNALVRSLRREWAASDQLDVWGFDTWGQTCQCPKCRALGNASDIMLVMAAHLREFLDRAESDGRLDRHVTLILCAYEGTATLEGPSRPVPSNLAKGGTLVTFYPINRCYAHAFDDQGCATNRRYFQALQSWIKARPALRIIMGEYYNVSKFEDLPLLFTRVMSRDWPACADTGVRGATYMHIPTVHWGMRAITQNLYAQLVWNPTVECARKGIAEYFRQWYGPGHKRMQKVYAITERAWAMCAQWRAWAADSVLSQLLNWNGRPPAKPMTLHKHLGNASKAIAVGKQASKALCAAIRLAIAARQQARLGSASQAPRPGAGINPEEQRLFQQGACVAARLAEDIRLLRYGFDVMDLTVALLAYYEALRRNPSDMALQKWAAIEAAADRLEQYIVPIDYENDFAGLKARDGLQRSQLGPLVERCRAFRLHLKKQVNQGK